MKVADILLEKPAGMSITEIADRCNVDASKMRRVLRNLASRHCFREGMGTLSGRFIMKLMRLVAPNTFANNRLSMQLLSGTPMHSTVELMLVSSRLALDLSDDHRTDECSHAVMSLAESMADPQWSRSYAPNQCAFNKWSGSSLPVFDWFEVRRRCACVYALSNVLEHAGRASPICSIWLKHARFQPGHRCAVSCKM